MDLISCCWRPTGEKGENLLGGMAVSFLELAGVLCGEHFSGGIGHYEYGKSVGDGVTKTFVDCCVAGWAAAFVNVNINQYKIAFDRCLYCGVVGEDVVEFMAPWAPVGPEIEQYIFPLGLRSSEGRRYKYRTVSFSVVDI